MKQEERTPEPESEDSFTPERVIEEVHRFLDTRGPGISAHVQPKAERETAPPQPALRERAPVPGENQVMALTLRKGRDMREADVAHRIHSCLMILSS